MFFIQMRLLSQNTYSPWANGGPRAPPSPMILREWYHFVQGTLRNHISENLDSLLIDFGVILILFLLESSYMKTKV